MTVSNTSNEPDEYYMADELESVISIDYTPYEQDDINETDAIHETDATHETGIARELESKTIGNFTYFIFFGKNLFLLTFDSLLFFTLLCFALESLPNPDPIPARQCLSLTTNPPRAAGK
jgi:hypothetical protein